MNAFIAGDDVALGEHRLAAVEIGDEAAGLANEYETCRHVPRRKIALPESVEPSRRDIGEIESRRAEAPQAGNLVLNGQHFSPVKIQVTASVMRQPAGDHSFVHTRSRGDAQTLVVEESA